MSGAAGLRDPILPAGGQAGAGAAGAGAACGVGGAALALGARPGPLTKLHFQINSAASGASEGYGCHGDGAERGSPGWPGLGRGEGAPRESPNPAWGRVGAAGPIVSRLRGPLPSPRFCIISGYGCAWGVPVAAWWPGIGALGTGACQQPPSRGCSFEDLFLFPVSQL